MSNEDKDVFASFNFVFDQYDLMAETMMNIMMFHAYIRALRDLCIKIAAAVQGKSEADVSKEYVDSLKKYAREVSDEFNAKYAPRRNPS